MRLNMNRGRAPVHAPAKTVHGRLARVVRRPAIGVASRRARAHKDDAATKFTLVQPRDGGPERRDGAEEVDLEMRLPSFEAQLGRGNLARGVQHTGVEDDGVDVLVRLHSDGDGRRERGGVCTENGTPLSRSSTSESSASTDTSHSMCRKVATCVLASSLTSGDLCLEIPTTSAPNLSRRSLVMARPIPLVRRSASVATRVCDKYAL